MDETRTCKKCGEVKPITSFPRHSGRSAHLREHTCGMCKRRAHLKRHPEKKRHEDIRRRARAKDITVEEYLSRRYAERPLIAIARKTRKSKALKCPIVRACPKIDYQVNRQYYLAKSRRWSKNNPEKALAKKQRRRFRLAGVEQSLSPAQWEAIKRAFHYCCAYCRRRTKLTMDHVTPISLGGDHVVSNVVPACARCNSSKRAGPPPCPVQPMLIV
jgi:5-methylcytosine-specific restriction endonuclease McrA